MSKRAEYIVITVVFVLLVALVIVLLPQAGEERRKTDCLNNLKDLSAMMQGTVLGQPREPSEVYSLLHVFREAEADGQTAALLFCPGDEKEKPPPASAYHGIELDRKGWGHLTSYAWRDGRLPGCAKVEKETAFLADDSLDHHRGGINVAYIGGPVRWRSFDEDTVAFGDGATLPELRCLRVD